MRPMRPPATASAKGRGDSMTAAEAAVMESTSDSFSWSEEMTLASTCTSSGRPLGNNGRIGRSMRRETRVSRTADFTAEEAAGDTARGIHALGIFHGQREEAAVEVEGL
jgi:hypothetical protein